MTSSTFSTTTTTTTTTTTAATTTAEELSSLPRSARRPRLDNARTVQLPVPETYEPIMEQALYLQDDDSSSSMSCCPWTIVEATTGQALDFSSSNASAADSLTPPRLARKTNPTQVYAWLPDYPTISLDHHRPGWGCVKYAVVYSKQEQKQAPRDDTTMTRLNNTFVAPTTPTQTQLVAVKILNKQVVQAHLDEGNAENPYREICRAQQLGDDVHVLKPVEVLQDHEHLFIVTPMGFPLDRLLYSKPLSHQKAHAYFVQMLRILIYLQRNHVHARDVKPENFVVLPTGHLVLMDLAMSLQIPQNPITGSPSLLNLLEPLARRPTWHPTYSIKRRTTTERRPTCGVSCSSCIK